MTIQKVREDICGAALFLAQSFILENGVDLKKKKRKKENGVDFIAKIYRTLKRQQSMIQLV